MGTVPAALFDWAGIAGVTVFLPFCAALQTGLILGQGYLHAALTILAATRVPVSLSRKVNVPATADVARGEPAASARRTRDRRTCDDRALTGAARHHPALSQTQPVREMQ